MAVFNNPDSSHILTIPLNPSRSRRPTRFSTRRHVAIALVAALLPVDGSDPKQYTFEFVKADAKLAEGAITDGWFEEDAIPGINYPDLKKIGNSVSGISFSRAGEIFGTDEPRRT